MAERNLYYVVFIHKKGVKNPYKTEKKISHLPFPCPALRNQYALALCVINQF